jgi:hypothetical protein
MSAEMRILLPSVALGLALAGVSLAPAAADDEELAVPPIEQTNLALTVYEQDMALVQDRRMVTLTEGLNRVAFEAVSAKLMPDTVVVDGLGDAPLSLLEQRFEANIISQRALVEASVGKQVRVAVRDGQSGAETIESGTLLAAKEGIMLKIGDRIESLPGRIIFNSVPAGLRAQPALVLALTSLKGGSLPIEIDYLSSGLAWSANYVAELEPDERHLSLSGRATVTNNSGSSYEDARLTLVAGSLNLARSPEAAGTPPLLAAMAPRAMPMAKSAGFSDPAPVGDYYRFTLDRKIGIGDRESIQLALFHAGSVPVEKEYRIEDSPPVTSAVAAGEPEPLSFALRYSFPNTKTAGLGRALPQGIARIYKRAADGGIAFLGEDQLSETPLDKTVALDIGRAFDVTAERKQTSFAELGERSYEAGIELHLKNARDEPVLATVYEDFRGDWRILQSSDTHSKASAGAELWRISLPAHGEHLLTFKVATHF